MSHGVIHTGFWSDPKVRAWPDDCKLLAAYFITGPHRNILGCARIPNGYITEDLGWDTKRLARALQGLSDTKFLIRDSEGWTLILNQLRHDPLKHENHLKGAIRLLKLVPTSSPVYQPLYERLAANAEAMGKALDIPLPAPAQAISKGSPPYSPSPAPSITPSPSPAKTPSAPTPRDELSRVLDSERADAVIDHRQKLRKPLTAHAAKLLAEKLSRCRDGPNVAADAMIANGWLGFDPAWLENRNGQQKPSDLQRRTALAREFLDFPEGDTGPGGGVGDQAATSETIAGVSDGPNRRH